MKLNNLVYGFLVFWCASYADINLGSRENDPASIVENVSVINGDYTEVEVDLIVPAPDSLVISRFYSSNDTPQIATFGGWRFNPHCFLTIEKDPKNKTYTTAEGRFEKNFVRVGNPDGSILTYIGWVNVTKPNKRILFQVEPNGIANTAKGDISGWTNLKNNELYYDPQTDGFELQLCSEGQRFYSKIGALYLLTHEILPSGNKIFYEFNDKGQITLIKETNASEVKILAWVKLQYGDGIHLEANDGKFVNYQFQQDSSGDIILTSVIRSHKPELHYQYQVKDNKTLLLEKDLPEGRFVSINYENNRVKSVTTPVGLTEFLYRDGYTEVNSSGNRKSIYRVNEYSQLISIEQYLEGSLYRIHKKSWGIKSDFGDLLSISVEDREGNVFYHKCFIYDDNRNIAEEGEYGDFAGTGAVPLSLDDDGLVDGQVGNVKYFSYFSGKNTHGFFQRDAKGSGVKYWYKKGTNLLVKKFVLNKGHADSEEETDRSEIKQRYFYTYNEDAALVKLIVDDGEEVDSDDLGNVKERTITDITAKKELPNVGAPEVIEQKFTSEEMKSEILLKKTINHFDTQGNIISQDIYDADDLYRYTINKRYSNGMLIFETDPMGNETHYSYDANNNLTKIRHLGISTEYAYDLGNRIIHTIEICKQGNTQDTQIIYDQAGYKCAEIDAFGNETTYVNDSLGRSVSITYPEVSNGVHSSIKPTYNYTYDIFDNQISVTDPQGRILTKSYNVKGNVAEINYLDGSQEFFRYDSGGNLHHHYFRNRLLEVFDYDYLGRVDHIWYYPQGSNGSDEYDAFKEKKFEYSAFHKIREDSNTDEITYNYYKGHLAKLTKGDQKTEFIYDSLGRMVGIKKWKSKDAFTLEIKELDLLDRVVEERVEDSKGKILTKTRYVYNNFGKLFQIIGYPQNNESILMQYEYDGFGRLCKTIDAMGDASQFFYDDNSINEWGQKVRKCTRVDSRGIKTCEVFDNNGKLIQAIKKNSFGNILSSFEASYDCFGNKVGEGSAGNQLITYKMQNDHLELVCLGEDSCTQFKYNAYGDLKAKYSAGFSAPISYIYDEQANLEAIYYKEDDKEIKFKLRYDHNDNLTCMERSSSNSSFSLYYKYNANGLVLSEKIKDEFGSYDVSRSFDGEGKIKSLQLPDGSCVEYVYEGPFVKAVSRLKKDGKEFYRYEVSSRDLMGNILEETLPGNLGSRNQFWDEAGRRTEITTDFFQDRANYDQFGFIKKRDLIYEEETDVIEYDYNDSDQLTLEKNYNDIEQNYEYDSRGNRIKRNNSIYEVNPLNQLISAEGASYTFSPNGNLTIKTIGAKNWIYHTNPLRQIISIEDPDQNKISFTYDLTGRRLSKKIEIKGKKPKTLRFFYLNNTEIGCVDEKGTIVELKVPSDPNNPEAPCIALEIKKEVYVPIYDLRDNIACLVNPQKREIVETYRYSAYGEEQIADDKGSSISDSKIGNPWRYHGKRIDKELGLIYFGYRYYDPEIGRWISLDPAWTIDGPNLYTFVHNNPIKYTDQFGLFEIDEDCRCVLHNHPGWHNAPPDCVCICGKNDPITGIPTYISRIGSNIGRAVSGIGHGAIDFALLSLYDIQTSAVYMGSEDIEMSFHERADMIEAIEQSQAQQMSQVDNFIMDLLSIDPSDKIYQSFRSGTTVGLEVSSLVAGGYGLVKGVMAFNKLARAPIQLARLVKNETTSFRNFLTRSQIKSYLSSAESLNKVQIISDLESIGLNIKGSSPDGRFINFGDKMGNIRVKIHPQDKITLYDHLHVYDRYGNSLDKNLEMVDRRSLGAHIPYGGD